MNTASVKSKSKDNGRVIKGMNRDMASIRIELVREAPIKKCQLLSPKDVCNLLYKRVSKLDREHFFVIPLTTKNQVIGINLASMGSLTSSVVHPREVFKSAILANAASVILVHNHPSGDPMPSPDDKEITIRLKQAGDILGIKVNDHIILGGDKSYYSFLDNKDIDAGMLKNNSVSTAVHGSRMLSIKKVIGKDEKQVALEDVYNKLCGLETAYSSILNSEVFSPGGDSFSSASIGLSNLFTETLREMDEMMNSESRTETLT